MADQDRAEAFWITAPGCGELRDAALPRPGPGQVLVETLYSGVSRGTEMLVFGGRVPAGVRARMRAPHQEGEFDFPVKYGYANVGRVLRGPAELAGGAVFCLYPHQTRFVVDAGDVIALPEGVPAERAVLAANVETAVNGLWDAGIAVGDRVAVVGGGVVGCLVAYLAARVPGCEVELVDVDAGRATVAAALGARFASPAEARPGADLVVHASGDPAGLRTALSLAGDEVTIVELSWFGDREVQLPLGESFHHRRLTLRSSQVGSIAPARRARWTHRRRLALALELLRDPALDALITSEGLFADLPSDMERLARPGPHLCHRVRYGA
ncbi:MAG TPA: dehydrogenase [Kofleriaceae bacterium]|nr:dehydrogenase [Kofleriaceae bacterium]